MLPTEANLLNAPRTPYGAPQELLTWAIHSGATTGADVLCMKLRIDIANPNEASSRREDGDGSSSMIIIGTHTVDGDLMATATRSLDRAYRAESSIMTWCSATVPICALVCVQPVRVAISRDAVAFGAEC